MAKDKMAKFKDLVSQIGEHFSDFVLIVCKDNGLNWRMSDRTFALGACLRLNTRLQMEDELAMTEEL